MHLKLSRLLRSSTLLLLTSVFLVGCNSSETADSGTGSGLPTGVDEGDVTLLITDHPTSAYDEMNVTARSVSLIGEPGQVHLMKKSRRFNLLDLRNSFCKLSKTKARVGSYSRVRFEIGDDVELVKRDADGNVIWRHTPKWKNPDKRFIDLVADKQFSVGRHHHLVVKLDLDAEGSLETDPENPDEPVFDPNATVETDEVPADTTEPPQQVTPVLMKEQGKPQNLTATSFDLCVPDPADAAACLAIHQVNIVADTVVWDTQLNAGGTLSEITSVMVIGHLDVATDAINALHVVQVAGRVGSYAGDFAGAVDTASTAGFTITSGAYAGTSTANSSVTLQARTGIYDDAGNALDSSAIGPGVAAETIGLLTPSLMPGQSSSIKPAVIIIPTQ